MNDTLACRKQGKQALVAATILQKSNDKKMKTPIQKAIERVQLLKAADDIINPIGVFTDILEGLLEEESEYIEMIYERGLAGVDIDGAY